MNDTSSSTPRIAAIVLVILAVVGILLGASGLMSVMSVKKAVEDLKVKADGDLGRAGDLENDVRSMNAKMQTQFGTLNRDLVALRDQYSNSVAKAVAPVKGDAAGVKKNDKAVQPADPNGVYHTIKPGDFLGRVAKQYGTTVDAILKLNPGLDPKKVKKGQKVRVR
jgi:LysM repeat protein